VPREEIWLIQKTLLRVRGVEQRQE
jgi:hypothetical protein